MERKICIVFDKCNVNEKGLDARIKMLQKIGCEVDLMPLMGAETLKKGIDDEKECTKHYDFKIMREFMSLIEKGYRIMAIPDTTAVCNFLWRFGVTPVSMKDIFEETPIKELIESGITLADYKKYNSKMQDEVHSDIEDLLDILASTGFISVDLTHRNGGSEQTKDDVDTKEDEVPQEKEDESND